MALSGSKRPRTARVSLRTSWAQRLSSAHVLPLQSEVLRCDGVNGAEFSEHVDLLEPDVQPERSTPCRKAPAASALWPPGRWPMLPTHRPPGTCKAELRSGGVLEDQGFPPSSAGPSLRVRAPKGAGPERPSGGRVRRAASMAHAPISTPMKTAKIPTVNQPPCPKIINPTPARHRPFAAMSRYKGPRRYSMHLP